MLQTSTVANVAVVFRSVRNYRRSFSFLWDPVFALGCNRTSVKLSGKKLMKMNVNGVKGVGGHHDFTSQSSPVNLWIEVVPRLAVNLNILRNLPLSLSECLRKRIVVNLKLRHARVLVTSDRDELGLREVKHPSVTMAHAQFGDNQPQSVLLHGVDNDLKYNTVEIKI